MLEALLEALLETLLEALLYALLVALAADVFEHLLKNLAHFTHSLCIFFEVSYPFRQQPIANLAGIGLKQVAHQAPQLVVTPIGTVYIQDVRSVVQRSSTRQLCALETIRAPPLSEWVSLHNKDYPLLR